MDVRNADAAEVEYLARLWHDGWHESHAPLLPRALTDLRTVASFRERLAEALADIRVVGPRLAPLGFCIVKGDELYQLFVAAEARGSGAAVALIDDGEATLARNGVAVAWLACAIGNDRAARFYEKRGWHRAATVPYVADTSAGPFRLHVWRYEKALSGLER
jgi:ribosomal protein S18 acetylase RimI-like enzyme